MSLIFENISKNGRVMKSKIKEHSFGYDVFKENIPFSKLEENDVLLTPYDEFKRNHNWSFLSMNDDYIELVDQSYARLGKGISLLVFISPLVFFIIGYLVYMLVNPFYNQGIFLYIFIIFIYSYCFLHYMVF